jgi:thioredoxin reductase (NADPH)
MTASIENFPGFEDISGYELMDKMKQQAIKLGVQFVNDYIVEVDFSNRPFVCSSENGHSYQARAIIVATGSSAMWLNLESEKKYLGYGVSACATCDGFFYRGRTVAVIGGGNSAVAEALYLATLADKVILVHRRNQLRADKILQDRVLSNEKIVVEWDSVVEEVLGVDEPKKVTGIKIKNVKTDEMKEISLEGVFVAVGHKPNTDIFKGNLVLDEKGYIVTHENSSVTDVEGVFAAGDVKDPKYKQAVISAGSGAMAAMDAVEFLEQNR